MNRKPYLIAACLVALLIMSCNKRYYAPGLYQNDVQFMIKPHSKDSIKTRVYASGVYLSQSGAGGQGSSNSGLLNIYRSHTLPHFNFSYGAIGYAGSYDRLATTSSSGAEEPLVHKTFTGYGFNGSGSFYLSTRKTDFRILGVDLVYTHEGGNYLSFRKAQVGQPDVVSAPQAAMFSYGIFSEFIVRPGENTNFGLKLFVNHTTGNINRIFDDQESLYGRSSATMMGFTTFVGYKHFNFFTSAAFGTTFGDLNGAGQLGLAYKF